MKKLYLFGIVLTICFSCADTEPVSFTVGRELLELEPGTTFMYDVEEIVFAAFPTVDTLSYQERFVLNEISETSTGSLRYFFQIDTRPHEQAAWSPASPATYRISSNEAVYSRDNRSEIVLIFPLLADSQWDAGKYIVSPSDGIRELSFVADYYAPYVLPGASYPSAVRIMTALDTTNLLFRKLSYQVFAPHLAMIETYQEDLQFCNNGDIPDPNCIETGRIKHRWLIKHD